MAAERDESDRSVVLGVFPHRGEADTAVDALLGAGFRGDSISVMTRNTVAARDIGAARDTEAEEGAAAGAVTGGAAGGIGGLLVGGGALAIPGVGPVLAVGPLVAGLAGLATGAGAGGAIGALVGIGIPDDDADWMRQQLREGAVLVGVPTGWHAREAEQIFYARGAHSVRWTTVLRPKRLTGGEIGPEATRQREAPPSTPAEPPRTAAPDIGPRPAPPPPSAVAPEPRYGATPPQPRAGAAARARAAHREVFEVARTETTETMGELREHPTQTIFEQFERVPGSFYYFATLGSILASLALYASGRKWASLFVGLWAPSITSMAMFLKMLHPSREVRGR